MHAAAADAKPCGWRAYVVSSDRLVWVTAILEVLAAHWEPSCGLEEEHAADADWATSAALFVWSAAVRHHNHRCFVL